MRLAWLIFALLVCIIVFVPAIVHGQGMYVCKDGVCYLSEELFRALVDLARKGMATCA